MPLDFGDPHEKARELLSLIETDIRDRSDAIAQKTLIRNLYYGMNRRVKRYVGQGDVHLHVMADKIDNIVSKEMNAFFAIDPHVHVGSVPPLIDPMEAKDAEKVTNWAVDNDIPDFYRTFEGWLRNRHTDSVAAVKAFYVVEDRHTVVNETTNVFFEAGSIDLVGSQVPEKRLKTPAEVLGSVTRELFIIDATRNGKKINPTQEQELEGLQFIIDFVEDRTDYTNIFVEFKESRHNNEIIVSMHRPVKCKDNVEVEIIEFEDLVVPARARCLQSAPRLAQKHWLNAAEAGQRVKDESWDITEEELQLLGTRGRNERQEEHPMERRGLKAQKDRATGVRQFTASSKKGSESLKAYNDDKALFFEVYVTEDLDGDGIFEEIVYQVAYGITKVVHAEYLQERNGHGRRPFSDLHSIPISNRYYGWSIGQILASVNLEVDTIVNMVNDAQELINNPFFFYVPTALNADEKALKNLRPGQGIPINDPNGVIFPKFPQQPLANLSTMDSLLLYADRLTIAPQATGSTQVRNSPRTARGTLAMLGEAAIKVDSFITAAQKSGWGELMYQIYALYEHNASDETWEAVTGRPRAESRSKDLRNRVKFTFKGNTVNTNREVMSGKAQLIYNTLLTNPLYATDPLALRNVTEFFLRHHMDAGQIEHILPQLPPGMARRPMSQTEELEIIRMGMPVDVLPTDDHGTHLREVFQFQGNAQFNEWTDLQVGMLAAHAIQHQRALAQQQQTGALAQGGTQANNVPQGVTQDLNVLEGGVTS